jgi:hypothetical protein
VGRWRRRRLCRTSGGSGNVAEAVRLRGKVRPLSRLIPGAQTLGSSFGEIEEVRSCAADGRGDRGDRPRCEGMAERKGRERSPGKGHQHRSGPNRAQTAHPDVDHLSCPHTGHRWSVAVGEPRGAGCRNPASALCLTRPRARPISSSRVWPTAGCGAEAAPKSTRRAIWAGRVSLLESSVTT